MNITNILKNLSEQQGYNYIRISRIISTPLRKYPYGNNIEIRFTTSNSLNEFYSVHFTGDAEVNFVLKQVISNFKAELLSKGTLKVDAFFSASATGNSKIQDTPINLLNLLFHSFNLNMTKDYHSSSLYYLNKMVDIKNFEI